MPNVPVASQAPVTLRLAVWLLAAESAGLGLLCLVLLTMVLSGGAQTGRSAIGTIAFVLVIAAGLGLLSYALRGRRAWARGPAIVLHMLMFPFGLANLQGGQLLVGALSLVLGIAGTVLLLAPGTRIAVGRD